MNLKEKKKKKKDLWSSRRPNVGMKGKVFKDSGSKAKTGFVYSRPRLCPPGHTAAGLAVRLHRSSTVQLAFLHGTGVEAMCHVCAGKQAHVLAFQLPVLVCWLADDGMTLRP